MLPSREHESSDAPSFEKWNAELAFRPVVEATADKAGLDFMRALVKNLAQSLNVAYTFVAEFAGDSKRVRTIAGIPASMASMIPPMPATRVIHESG